MSQTSRLSSPTRFLLAYHTAMTIFFSYLFLSLLKKVFGEKRLQQKIEATHQKNANRLLKNLLKLKGLFIKIGQMISVMGSFLPKAYIENLKLLQDAVPPHPYQEIEARFLEEFKKTPDQIFESFEKKPIASASLGQVHSAFSKDGTKLAVKVQYPKIEQVLTSDLKILKRILSVLNLIFPNYNLKRIYTEIAQSAREELDFLNEGKNLETIANNLKDEASLVFPKIYWNYSTKHILTLEWMEGEKISDPESLKKAAINPKEVAEKILHAYCRQVFIDGFYHADPHPGNFLVQKCGEETKIVLIDFGSTGRISETMRLGSIKFIEGVIHQDTSQIRQALKEMGFIAKSNSEAIFDKMVDFFYEKLKNLDMQDLKNLSSGQYPIEVVDQFKKMNLGFSEILSAFNLPKDWALLERALILLLGLTTQLDPNQNPISIILPYAEKFVLGKDRNLADLMMDAIKEWGANTFKLPNELLKTLKRLNDGEIEFFSKNSEQAEKTLKRAARRLEYAIVIFGSLFLCAFFYEHKILDFRYPLYLGGFWLVWIWLNQRR